MHKKHVRKHWLKLGCTILKLYFFQKEKTSELIAESYNEIAKTYDATWTNHMQHLSEELINHLNPVTGADVLDVTCGTGFVTGKLAKSTKGKVVGVDISMKMIDVAKSNYGFQCEFIKSDVLDYLKKCPSESFDVITCAWGIGYSYPYRILKEISRILRPNGKVAIIDNSLFTLKEVLLSAFFTILEQPDALSHVMKVRFIPSEGFLRFLFRCSRIRVLESWSGSKTYYASNGKFAVDRLVRTGAAAGYEKYIKSCFRKAIADRFSEIFEQRYKQKKGVPITHRYIAVIGCK